MIEMLREGPRSRSKPEAVEYLAAHLAPKGTHYFVPRPARSWDVLPPETAEETWFMYVLLRMNDGAQVVESLGRSLPSSRFLALPRRLAGWEEYRIARLASQIRRDTYLWERDHRHDHTCEYAACIEKREGHCDCYDVKQWLRHLKKEHRPAPLERGSAQEAVRLLMARGFIEIRATSHLVRKALEEGKPEKALHHVDHMGMIADICHNLPGDFFPKRGRERERRAVESLKFHLRELKPDDDAAQWVRAELDEQGYDYAPLLPGQARWRRG
ncbi:hypothetical protein ACOZ38_43460 [Sphaerisporangium viridialbum]|uniref:hypothetical protein n=1 Tax=Sphaerisporangium viridialbum TaxID=46189 RepID=UPI003C77F436